MASWTTTLGEQPSTGTASVLVLVLAYLLVVEAMMALLVLLTEFLWSRIRVAAASRAA